MTRYEKIMKTPVEEVAAFLLKVAEQQCDYLESCKKCVIHGACGCKGKDVLAWLLEEINE